MRIKKADTVKVMAGKDKGKEGKVIQVFPELRKVVVEGVNLTTRHLKIRRQGDKGQKIEYSGPIAAANVMLVCPKCAKPTRLGSKSITSAGKTRKVRVCKKCTEVIE